MQSVYAVYLCVTRSLRYATSRQRIKYPWPGDTTVPRQSATPLDKPAQTPLIKCNLWGIRSEMPLARQNSTLSLDNLKGVSRIIALLQLYSDFIFANHLVLQIPPCTPAKLGDDSVTVAKHIDIKIYMRAWLHSC